LHVQFASKLVCIYKKIITDIWQTVYMY